MRLPTAEIRVGHVLDLLADMDAGSAHMVVTSPPYYAVRSYQTEPQIWGGACEEHEWQADPARRNPGNTPSEKSTLTTNNGRGPKPGDKYACEHEWRQERTERANAGGGKTEKQSTNAGSFAVDNQDRAIYSDTCARCGAFRGELGGEPTLEQFVANIVTVFRAVRRVLRDDGVCFLNMGDSYARPAGKGGSGTFNGRNGYAKEYAGSNVPAGLKEKDLCLVPARCALALQADDWYIRSEIVWAKGLSFCEEYSGSSMPESVTDRPSKSHEMVYLLTKNPNYFYDADAIRENYSDKSLAQLSAPYEGNGRKEYAENGVQNPSDLKRRVVEAMAAGGGRNLRSVWAINPQPWQGAHFATMPVALATACIQLGSSEHGVCPACQASWERVTERGALAGEAVIQTTERPACEERGVSATSALRTNGRTFRSKTQSGWQPTCNCPVQEPVPARVLDPFAGSGTSGVAALQLGRDFLGCELNPEFARLAERRIDTETRRPMRFGKKPVAGQHTLFLVDQE